MTSLALNITCAATKNTTVETSDMENVAFNCTLTRCQLFPSLYSSESLELLLLFISEN